jgi:hypothetical protein
MSTRTSTIETCNNRHCDKTYKRYAYQVKKRTGLYCSQRCASIEQSERERESLDPRYKTVEKQCIYCNAVMLRPIAKHCNNCSRIKKSCDAFGLTIRDYFDMLEKQGETCAICKTDQCSTKRNFAIDHDHDTGRIRGLLCCGCNIQLGWYETRKDAIIDYMNAKVGGSNPSSGSKE